MITTDDIIFVGSKRNIFRKFRIISQVYNDVLGGNVVESIDQLLNGKWRPIGIVRSNKHNDIAAVDVFHVLGWKFLVLALMTGNTEELAISLQSINDLAKSSPFKALADIGNVQRALTQEGSTFDI